MSKAPKVAGSNRSTEFLSSSPDLLKFRVEKSAPVHGTNAACISPARFMSHHSHEGRSMQNDARDRETLHADDIDTLAALWQDLGGSD